MVGLVRSRPSTTTTLSIFANKSHVLTYTFSSAPSKMAQIAVGSLHTEMNTILTNPGPFPVIWKT